MKIFIGGDHASFELKKVLVPYLKGLGHDVSDMGAHTYVETDDYPAIIASVAMGVFKDPENFRGIVMGGSGQGEAIVANRLPGIRAAVYYGGKKEIVALSREHNNSNVLALGARFLTPQEAQEAVKMWLETPFSGDKRHVRRNEAIETVYEQ